jgi:hypothetical protein
MLISATPKVRTVLFVEDPTPKTTTQHSSRSGLTIAIASTAHHLNVQRTITPLRTGNVCFGNIGLIAIGSSTSSNAIEHFSFLFLY